MTAADYQQLVQRIQDLIRVAVPAGETVVVVSKGDDELLNLAGHEAWHFPRTRDGRYAGYHPEDSAAAISHLEELRAAGARYLLLPSTSFWWLDFYEGFRLYLDRFQALADNKDCVLFRLVEDTGGRADRPTVLDSRLSDVPRQSDPALADLVEHILPRGALVAVLSVVGERSPALQGAQPWDPHAAVAHTDEADRELSNLAASGVEFLVIPRDAFEWFGQHPSLADSLRRGHRFVTMQKHVCEIYELSTPESDGTPPPADAPPGKTSASAARKPSLFERFRRLLGRRDA
jgi:hypothetical protein